MFSLFCLNPFFARISRLSSSLENATEGNNIHVLNLSFGLLLVALKIYLVIFTILNQEPVLTPQITNSEHKFNVPLQVHSGSVGKLILGNLQPTHERVSG